MPYTAACIMHADTAQPAVPLHDGLHTRTATAACALLTRVSNERTCAAQLVAFAGTAGASAMSSLTSACAFEFKFNEGAICSRRLHEAHSSR